MLINLKVKTLDARTHDFNIDNDITIREFKDKIAEKTNISAENQRLIYQGRVLADERLIKDYDVDGKVLHVAERPPFSQRVSSSSSNTRDPRDSRLSRSSASSRSATGGTMRNSPLFRAIDGMLVGTMTIPLTAQPTASPANVNPGGNSTFASSSSFCMNRITVARHMINCANNIGAYLENPEVGLNNPSLDILERGRWTMESTVVEVGVTASDMPRNQNIIDMVQGAVTAALSRNNTGRNYTVVQLPSVYTSNDDAGSGSGAASATARVPADEAPNAMNADSGSVDTDDAGGIDIDLDDTTATVFIEDVIETDDGILTGNDNADSDIDVTAGAANVGTASGANSGAGSDDNDAVVDAGAPTGMPERTVNPPNAQEDSPAVGNRRRTNTNVLAEVIEQYRAVQTRLSPFVDQYYELLRNEPNYGENDTAEREANQRVYDRVSEAFHYLSHAQHAISDLMLNLSQPAPRFLTCRPILVEQSGYIRSNNILTPNVIPMPMRPMQQPPQQQQQQRQQQTQPLRNIPIAVTNAAETAANAAVNAAQASGIADAAARTAAAAARSAALAASAAMLASTNVRSGTSAATGLAVPTNAQGSSIIEDPVDAAPDAASETGSGVGEQRQQQRTPDNQQMSQMARLIQAMVSSAAHESELHVQINAPNVVSINLPVLGPTATGNSPPSSNTANSSLTSTNNDSLSSEPSTVSDGSSTPTNNVTPAAVAAAGAGTPTTTGASTAASSETPVAAVVSAITLPTTSTQTRSTARPQLQIGQNNNWNSGRFMSNTAFDRFLPCNSHHIRDPERMPNIQSPRTGTSTSTVPSSTPVQPLGTSPIVGRTSRSTQSTGRMNATTMTETRPSHSRSTATASTNTASDSTRTHAIVNTSANSSNVNNVVVDNRTLRGQLRNFIIGRLFGNMPISGSARLQAIDRALTWFKNNLLYLPQYEQPQYNARESVCNILRLTLKLIINLVSEHEDLVDPAAYEQRLKLICEQFRIRLFSVLIICVGRTNAELYWCQLMPRLSEALEQHFRGEAVAFLIGYLAVSIPITNDTADAQQFVVMRNRSELNTPPESEDVEMTDVASTSDASAAVPIMNGINIETANATTVAAGGANTSVGDVGRTDDDTSDEAAPVVLPQVVPGSEPWHAGIPNDWLPVITRDLRQQLELPPTPMPYSDAYISGMSAKRRKIIQSEKPSPNVETLIAEGVRRAMQVTGLTASTASSPALSCDELTRAISQDPAVQSSYTEQMRFNVRERLKTDADYKKEKYPQTAKFVEKKKKRF